MPDDTTDDRSEFDRPLTDPEDLFDRETISSEHIVREQDEPHFETRQTVSGFAIVGVTNDDGEVLLTSSSDGDWWRLPHARVDHGEDYASVARAAVETELDVDVEVERVVHARRFDALLEGSPAADHAEMTDNDDDLPQVDGFARSYDVLFEASVDSPVDGQTFATERESDTDGEPETVVEWFGTTPDGAPGGLPGSDLRRFIG